MKNYIRILFLAQKMNKEKVCPESEFFIFRTDFYFNSVNCLFLNEHLRPIVAVFHITDSDVREVFVQDIGAVAGAVHPCIHYLLRRGLAHGNVFPGRTIFDSIAFHHIKR